MATTFSRCRLTHNLRLMLLLGCFYGFSIPGVADEEAPQSIDAAYKIVCLRTEFLPVVNDPDALPYRIIRELGRQAVLIAARDEIGLATRDETLDEPFPDVVIDEEIDLHLKFRIGADEDELKLELVPSHAIIKEGNSSATVGTPMCGNFDRYFSLSALTSKLEPQSREELVDALQKLGYDRATKPINEDFIPPESVEQWLGDMNFVSQYAAVRAAHQAIKKHGQSQALLGVLVRGYAHLALMTQHHWKSDNEVFAARSLLYAERMVNTDKNSIDSRSHRAYARAIIGLHADALDEMKEIEKLAGDGDSAKEFPKWVSLIGPYCNFERDALLAKTESYPELTQLINRLAFEHFRAIGDDRWLFEAARTTAIICPEEYGIYAALADTSRPLAVKRTGAYYGPVAFSNLLVPRVLALTDLPKYARNNASSDDKPVANRPADPNPDDAFSIVPAYLAQDLIAFTKSNMNADEPSWATLGNLIAEEQFVQVANYFAVIADGTESSMAEEVAAVMPIVQNHRYARYIESSGVNAYQDTARFYEVLGDMQFVDPRGNMHRMIQQMWQARDNDGQPRRGSLASWHAFYGRNFTFPGMFEPVHHLDYKWNDAPDNMQTMIAEEFARISPHAPQSLRLKMLLVTNPSYDRVSAWESEAGEDPLVFSRLGQKYQNLKQFSDAIRCYERSIALSPCKDAYVGLAESYRAAGQEEQWQPSLERFFEVESFGLDHALVHRLIAEDLIQKGDWMSAEPHANKAAETWSSWGMRLASSVHEALGDWEESEKWIREVSSSYPSSSGGEWYLWCRRTGRGDVKSSRRLAQRFYAADWLKTNDDGRHSLLVFNMLEDDLWAAFEDAKYLSRRYTHPEATLQNRVFHHLQLVFLARELKEAELEKQTMVAVRQTMEELEESDPELSSVVAFICKLLDGKDVTDDQRAQVDEHLLSKQIPEMRRCNHEYFIGRAFDFRGDTKSADEYLNRALRASYFNSHTATLAGSLLVARSKSPKRDNDNSVPRTEEEK